MAVSARMLRAVVVELVLPMAVSPTNAQTSARDPWQDDVDRFAAADRAITPPRSPIVFVGSSSTRVWPDLNHVFLNPGILNRGFGGSRLADVERLANRLVLHYQPRQVVIYAGDNDLAEGLLPAQIVADFISLTRRLRSNQANLAIAFTAIKPCPARAHLIAAARDVNLRIRQLTEGPVRCTFSVRRQPPSLTSFGRPQGGLLPSSADVFLWQRCYSLVPIRCCGSQPAGEPSCDSFARKARSHKRLEALLQERTLWATRTCIGTTYLCRKPQTTNWRSWSKYANVRRGMRHLPYAGCGRRSLAAARRGFNVNGGTP